MTASSLNGAPGRTRTDETREAAPPSVPPFGCIWPLCYGSKKKRTGTASVRNRSVRRTPDERSLYYIEGKEELFSIFTKHLWENSYFLCSKLKIYCSKAALFHIMKSLFRSSYVKFFKPLGVITYSRFPVAKSSAISPLHKRLRKLFKVSSAVADILPSSG